SCQLRYSCRLERLTTPALPKISKPTVDSAAIPRFEPCCRNYQRRSLPVPQSAPALRKSPNLRGPRAPVAPLLSKPHRVEPFSLTVTYDHPLLAALPLVHAIYHTVAVQNG